MILTLDIGNTNIKTALFDGKEMRYYWRMSTNIQKSSDEYGIVLVNLVREGLDLPFSQNYACDDCGISFEELTPRMFSFNNPYGACEHCTGLGVFKKIDPELIIPNKDLSILQGAIKASGWNSLDESSIAMTTYRAISKKYGIPLDVPIRELDKDAVDLFLYGTMGQTLEYERISNSCWSGKYEADFEGVINNLERRYKESERDYSKNDYKA